MIPDQPYGANGDQFSGFTNLKPASRKKSTAASLIATMVALKRALSRMPITSRAVIASTISTAGRLITAPGMRARGRAHPGRQLPAEAGQDALEVAAPPDRDGHGPDRVLEDEVPADRPGDDLAERRVGVGVRAAGDRDHRRELGVAESREGAGEPGRHVGDRDRGPRLVRGGGAGEHEDAGPDDRADAEEGEVERGQRPLQVLPLLDVVDELLDRLGLQQVRVQSSSCGFVGFERRDGGIGRIIHSPSPFAPV